jgi:hypothetical protein
MGSLWRHRLRRPLEAGAGMAEACQRLRSRDGWHRPLPSFWQWLGLSYQLAPVGMALRGLDLLVQACIAHH